MKYCKKPVVIDAIQLEDSVECMEALSSLGLDPIVFSYADEDPVLKIETLEGTMIANIGDYIIKGVNGEFYPCKPDIFGKSYAKFYPLLRIDFPLIQNPENTFCFNKWGDSCGANKTCICRGGTVKDMDLRGHQPEPRKEA